MSFPTSEILWDVWGTCGSDVYIMRVNSDNTVERIAVQTGIGLGGFVEVIGNVNQGDKIVTRGGERLQSGQLVVITDS